MAERRRDFVKLEIERAGMDLFAEHGYDSVTVQDIADAAGIGRRTFFRHFRSKDELLQAYDHRMVERALHMLHRRPDGESAAQALCNALLNTAEMPADQEPIAMHRNKVLQEAGADTVLAGSADVREAIIKLTAERMGLDPEVDQRPHIVVWAVFAAARAATRFWVSNGGEERLHQSLEQAFRYLLEGLDGRSGRRRQPPGHTIPPCRG